MSKRKYDEDVAEFKTIHKNKHTLDSDEEGEDDKYDVIREEDIVGQEDGVSKRYDDIEVTPFNLVEERQEGDFNKEGDFIWKKKEEIHDSWLDNIDWIKVKERTKEDEQRQDFINDVEEAENRAFNEHQAYQQILQIIQPGETVARALRRLGKASGDHRSSLSASQRWKRKKQNKAETVPSVAHAQSASQLSGLTGLADSILTRCGHMEIYEETYESIAYRLKKNVEEKPKTESLDMFADKDDGETPDVAWEFRWISPENSEGSTIHGPFSSAEMLSKKANGFFKPGTEVRKVLPAGGPFYNLDRIDFDLYV